MQFDIKIWSPGGSNTIPRVRDLPDGSIKRMDTGQGEHNGSQRFPANLNCLMKCKLIDDNLATTRVCRSKAKKHTISS